MAWFLRAVEQPDGRWSCRWGTFEYDTHEHLGQALEHLRELSHEFGTSVVFSHPLHGPAQRLDSRAVSRKDSPSRGDGAMPHS